jgi:rod shape-determining protein MreC
MLLLSNSSYQGSSYFNSSNELVALILTASNKTKEYFNLGRANQLLMEENARLKNQLTVMQLRKSYVDFLNEDSLIFKRFSFIPAKVINNSTAFNHNYITINKGSKDSIQPGMAVVTKQGIVGKVKSVSKNYATVISALHKELLTSAKLKSSKAIGSVRWDGVSPNYSKLLYIPRHINVKVGDTVVTSEFNSVYPEGELIGVVSDINLKPDDNFFNIRIKLSTDFSKLDYVYVIRNKLQAQLDSLEKISTSDKYEAK